MVGEERGRGGVFGLLCWAGPRCGPGPNEMEGPSIPYCTVKVARHYFTHTTQDACDFSLALSQVSFDGLIKELYKPLHKHGILMHRIQFSFKIGSAGNH